MGVISGYFVAVSFTMDNNDEEQPATHCGQYVSDGQ